MMCSRCQGPTVTEVFVDWSSGGGFLSFPGQRCLSCGDITDAIIMANRHTTPRRLLPKARHRSGTAL